MSSNNFLVFNPSPNSVTTEVDAAYLVDANRLGGFPFNAEFPAVLANKLFYQTSIFVAAFAQMMTAKGYPLNDADLATLVSQLTNVQTVADIRNGLIAVAYAPTVYFDCSTHSSFAMTLYGNSIATFANFTVGQQLTFIISQDSNGGHTFGVANANGFVAGSTEPNAVLTQQYIVSIDSSIRAVAPSVNS